MPDIQEHLGVDIDTSNPEKQLQMFVKQMLQSRLFIGSFQEKRYVDSLQDYRSVVVVSSDEVELIRDLEVVKSRVQEFYGEDVWIGITGPATVGAPAGHCIWTELPDEIFASFWYKISKIRFKSNEVMVRLKVIRPVFASAFTNEDSAKMYQEEDSHVSSTTEQNDAVRLLHESFNKTLLLAKTEFCLFLTAALTRNNILGTVKFLSVLIAALFTGAIRFFDYLGNFTIKCVHELSVLIKATSPIIIAGIDLIGKIIGGFYLLILSMWTGRSPRPQIYRSPYQNNANRIGGNDNSYGYNTVYFRALPMRPRQKHNSGVRITPLD